MIFFFKLTLIMTQDIQGLPIVGRGVFEEGIMVTLEYGPMIAEI